MEDNILQLCLHVAPFLTMGLIMVLNQLAAARRGDRKERRDALRLRAALRAELHALLGLYTENLRLVADREGYMLSGRPLLAVYRANLSRIIVLTEEEIATLVACSSALERLEALFAVHCKPSGNLAWKFSHDDTALAIVQCAILAAAATVEEALSVLTPLTPPCRPVSAHEAFEIMGPAPLEA